MKNLRVKAMTGLAAIVLAFGFDISNNGRIEFIQIGEYSVKKEHKAYVDRLTIEEKMKSARDLSLWEKKSDSISITSLDKRISLYGITIYESKKRTLEKNGNKILEGEALGEYNIKDKNGVVWHPEKTGENIEYVKYI